MMSFAFLFIVGAFAICPQPERDALWEMFQQCNGPQWPQDHITNWGSFDACQWAGITCNADSRVTSVVLEKNNMRCELPPSMGNLSMLTTLDISSNLVGTIPSAVRYFTHLEHLKLYQNQLTGTLPEWLNELRALQELAVVPAPPCPGLTGTIPTTFGVLPLKIFVLDSNHLEGKVPHWVQKVEFFHLRGSVFHGPCPNPIWINDRAKIECRSYPESPNNKNKGNNDQQNVGRDRMRWNGPWNNSQRSDSKHDHHQRVTSAVFDFLRNTFVIFSVGACVFYGVRWCKRNSYTLSSRYNQGTNSWV